MKDIKWFDSSWSSLKRLKLKESKEGCFSGPAAKENLKRLLQRTVEPRSLKSHDE